MDNLEKQFILRSKALLGYLAGRYTKEEKIENAYPSYWINDSGL